MRMCIFVGQTEVTRDGEERENDLFFTTRVAMKMPKDPPQRWRKAIETKKAEEGGEGRLL